MGRKEEKGGRCMGFQRAPLVPVGVISEERQTRLRRLRRAGRLTCGRRRGG